MPQHGVQGGHSPLPAAGEGLLGKALAACLLLFALACPFSKSATYFPLFAVSAIGLFAHLRAGGRLQTSHHLMLPLLLWTALACWREISLLANGAGPEFSPVERALTLLPVFCLAGLPFSYGWRERVAASAVSVLLALLSFIVIAGIFEAALGVRYPGGLRLISDEKLVGLFSHHIPAGGCFSSAAVFALCLLLFWKTGPRLRGFIASSVIVLLVGTLLSMSRTYFLSLAFTLPLVMMRKEIRTAAAGVIILVAVFGAALLLVPGLRERAASITDLRSNPSNLERIYLWKVARDIVADHPVSGIGYRQWGRKISDYTPRYEGQWKFTPASVHHAHNTYLHAAAETGLVGLLLFLGFWLSMLSVSYHAAGKAGDGSLARAMAYGSAFSLVNLFAGGFFEENFGTLSVALLMTFLLTVTFFVYGGRTAAPGDHP